MERRDRDQFDELLDGALRRYGNVEPRVGLEGRVLASLAANDRRARVRGPWVWALAGASVAAVFFAIWLGAWSRTDTPAHEKMSPVTRTRESLQSTSPPTIPRGVPSAKQIPVRRRRGESMKKTEPRLPQFPSAQPLGEQEQLLARYVRESPEEAVLAAQEQRKAEAERNLEEMAEGRSSSDDSSQPER